MVFWTVTGKVRWDCWSRGSAPGTLFELSTRPELILAVTGERQLLANEPVLLKSVQLRNPYIDPLNYIQVDMMRRLRAQDTGKKLGAEEADAARAVIELTINGISGGLKNTG